MEYKIISQNGVSTGLLGRNFEKTLEKLTAAVNEQIALGWEPLGGVSASRASGEGVAFFQALIKRR